MKTRKMTLPKVYRPSNIERSRYEEWMRNDLFRARVNPEKRPFCIVIPPPNITGSLHLGHALDNTIQDILIRYKRMRGFESLWIPGTDHAGIATQTVVEKELAKEGKTRHLLGREKFVEKVWQWREEYGRTIVMQLQRLGVSCDWNRERFTLDEICSRAVREAFLRLFEKGLIYRDRLIINWCPRCLTALSDLEVEHEERASSLWYLCYPFEEGEGGITIATTRPETILADTAVAVNPQDERYRELVGRKAILPLVRRKLPIIADPRVDPDFGTGALKITPAHDPADFAIGQDHDLPVIVCIDEKGNMNEEAGVYRGMDRDECRKEILKDLGSGGFLVKEEEYVHSVGQCYRCETVIEPYLSLQWFMRMKSLAKPAIEAVRDGRVRFVPERFSKTYLYWMENIRDWCISRQLWWGHRIPVWYCKSCHPEVAWAGTGIGHAVGTPTVREYREIRVPERVTPIVPNPGGKDPESCPRCASTDLIQDPDVLDTWFSSGMWPFSTMGWPDHTPDLEYFYPTSVLVTARDIIFLWVARMIMMGMEFIGDVPFRDVYIHATILARDGKRMSKSLGTGVDPLYLFEKYGTDATRFGLVYQTAQGQDIRYTEERMEMSRNFANKIWNAARLSLSLMNDELPPRRDPREYQLTLPDRWILSQINSVIKNVTDHLEEYAFDEVSRMLYDFFWDEFCDWFLEIIKPAFYEREDRIEQEKIICILEYVFSRYLRVLHPLMPFITEEIWRNLPGERPSISISPWPDEDQALVDPVAESEMQLLIECVSSIRNLRSILRLPPGRRCRIIVEAPSSDSGYILEANATIISRLSASNPLEIVRSIDPKPPMALTSLVRDIHILLPIEDKTELLQETERLKCELQELAGDLKKSMDKLSNQEFLERAPREIVIRELDREKELEEHARKLRERLKVLSGFLKDS